MNGKRIETVLDPETDARVEAWRMERRKEGVRISRSEMSRQAIIRMLDMADRMRAHEAGTKGVST